MSDKAMQGCPDGVPRMMPWLRSCGRRKCEMTCMSLTHHSAFTRGTILPPGCRSAQTVHSIWKVFSTGIPRPSSRAQVTVGEFSWWTSICRSAWDRSPTQHELRLCVLVNREDSPRVRKAARNGRRTATSGKSERAIGKPERQIFQRVSDPKGSSTYIVDTGWTSRE